MIRFLFPFCITIIAIAQQPLFERYTVEQGLSQNLVMSFVEDRHGFLWFGTKDGLNRFDGYSFRVFRNNISDSLTISSNYITSLHIDSSQILWIGTSGGGLNRYNEETETFTSYSHNTQDPASIPSNYVFKIISGYEGILYIATIDGGVCSFNPSTQKFSRILFDSIETTLPYTSMVTSICLAKDTTLWVSTISRGVFTYHIPTGKKEHFYKNGTKFGLTDTIATNIYEDSQGRIWIADEHGFDVFEKETKTFFHHAFFQNGAPLPGLSIEERTQGRYFINILRNQGYYDPETRDFQPLGIGISTKTYFDRSGMLWLSTGGHGLLKYNPLLERFNRKTGMFAIERFEKEFAEIKKRYGITLNARMVDKYTVVKDFSGTLWCSEIREKFSVFAYNTKTKQLRRYPFNDSLKGIKYRSPQKIIVANDNSVWLTFAKKIARYDSLNNTFVYYNLADFLDTPALLYNSTEYALLTAVYRDKNNILWIGTTSTGIIKFNEQTKKAILIRANIKDSHTLSNNYVLTIVNDPNDPTILWIGTDGGGFNRFDTKTHSVTHRFNTSNGIPNDVIYSIMYDKRGQLWMSSNNGIFSFDPVAMKVTAHYDMHDGLQSNEFNRYEYWKDETGKMFFGGIGGWNSFYPESIYTRTYVPPIVFTNIQVQNKSVIFPQPSVFSQLSPTTPYHITLTPEQNIISFEFSALDYAAPTKNLYMYRLKGFDTEWNFSGRNRTATYTNLDPGIYTFHVKGTNSDGVWNEQGASIQIIVLPPYYKTWWFRSGIIFLLVGLVIVFVHRRFSFLRREQYRQQEFSRQLLEHQEHDRERIAAELHDSLGQNLLVVKNRAVLGIREVDIKEKSKLHFEYISALVSDILKEVREISHNLRPYQLDRLGLSETLRSMVKKITESSALIINENIDDIDNCFTKEEEIHVYRIIQESLNNIIKHSGAKRAVLTVSYHPTEVTIIVQDDGKGFDETLLHHSKGFGIKGIRERVRYLNGELTLRSSTQSGTEIHIQLPIK